MRSTYTTPLGRYTVVIETTSTPRQLTPTEVRAEAEALVELLRSVYLVALGDGGTVKKGWTPEKKAAMVAKIKATRLSRGIDWPRGDNHWTRQPGYRFPRKPGLFE